MGFLDSSRLLDQLHDDRDALTELDFELTRDSLLAEADFLVALKGDAENRIRAGARQAEKKRLKRRYDQVQERLLDCLRRGLTLDEAIDATESWAAEFAVMNDGGFDEIDEELRAVERTVIALVEDTLVE